MAALALFMLTSCSDDDTTTTTPIDNVLLKKVVTIGENGIEITQNYTYERNKIISLVSSDGSSSFYTYTGNLITKFKTISPDGLSYESTVEYNSASQKTATTDLYTYPNNSGYGVKNVYIYNENGTITLKSYSGTLESQTELESTYTIESNNQSRIFTKQGVEVPDVYEHTFDEMKNPLKNVVGYKEYIAPDLNADHNIINGYKSIYETVYIFDYTYNSEKYPLTATQKISQSGEYSISHKQYFYE